MVGGFQNNAFQDNAFQMIVGGGGHATPISVLKKPKPSRLIIEEVETQEFIIAIQRLIRTDGELRLQVKKRVLRVGSLTLPVVREVSRDGELDLAVIREIKHGARYRMPATVLRDTPTTRAVVGEMDAMRRRLSLMGDGRQKLIDLVRLRTLSTIAYEAQTFKPERLFLEFLTVGDQRVCPICDPLHRQAWVMAEFPKTYIPPLHRNCRCFTNSFSSTIGNAEITAFRPTRVRTFQPGR